MDVPSENRMVAGPPEAAATVVRARRESFMTFSV
jgi:hypothetical protein